MFKNKIAKTLSLILASAIIVSSSNIGLAFSEASPEQEIIIETESSDKIEEQEIEDIKSQENNENIEFTEIEEIPPETNNFEENIVSDNSNSEYIEEEIEAKTVYTVNFYNGEDIIFTCEVEEGGSFELPDMSNDETFVKWQLNGEDFDNNGYIVTDNIDIIGVFDVDVSDIKEEKPVFYEKEIEGYKVTVLGNIPEDNTVTIELVNDNILEYSINQTLPSEETFTAYATFDINIYDATGEKWQPMDYDEIVSIKVEKLEDRKEEALKGLFTFEYDKEGKIVKVSPVTSEDVVDTVYRTSEGSVDELYVNSESEVGVECETEHFSTFTYGGITYNTTNATTTYTAGDNITAYWFSSDKLLALIGTGDMHNYGENLSSPWDSIKSNITKVYFDDRITTIGDYAFRNCENLALINSLPTGLTEIGNRAFASCTNLALAGSLPSNLTTLDYFAFSNCPNLALAGSLPSNLTTIRNDVFGFCDFTKTHFDNNLSSVTITSAMKIPTSYTVVDTFTDGKKADVVTTKYGYVGVTSSVGTASTYSGYTLKTDCTDAAITIGATDADRLTLTRVYEPAPTKVFTYNGKDYYDADATATYTAGDNITAYWYESDGVLGFVGTGDMYGWGYNATPWNDIKINITDIYLSDEITSIGNYAFNGCTNLKVINALPSGLTTIGRYAFANCKNLALTGELPSGLTYIGGSAFYNCSNLALSGELPSGLSDIEGYTFEDCTNLALTGELPSGLSSIGDYAFANCTNLALTGELPSGLTSIGSSVFYRCPNIAFTGTLPSGLTSIPNYAFNGCSNVAFTGALPSGLISIGSSAFSICSKLALSGELPSSLTSIGSNAFYYCYDVAFTGTLPSGLTSIESDSFRGCSELTLSGELPSGITKIGRSAFQYSPKIAFTGSLPSGITKIPENAFNGCTNLALSGELPSGITEIDTNAFTNCINVGFTGSLPSSLTKIGSSAFNGCKKLALTGDIPLNVSSIDTSVFSNVDVTKTHFDKNLSSVNIVNNMAIPMSYTITDTFTDGKKADVVTTKYGYVGATSSAGTAPTYEGYTLLTDCTDTTLSLGKNGEGKTNFSRSYAVTDPGYTGINWEIGSPTASDVVAKLYYYNKVDETEGYKLVWIGSGDTKDYPYHSGPIKNYAPWESYSENIKEIEIRDGITSIGVWAFAYCKNLTDATLAGSINSIGSSAFFGTALTNCNLPDNLEEISNSAFNGCTNLALTGELPSGLTSIGDYAFYKCENLALTGSLPSGLTTIGESTFDGCTNLALTGDIPSSLTSIGRYAFYKCKNLALSGELPSGLTVINDSIFSQCSQLKLSGELPPNITKIGKGAFYQCSKVTFTGKIPSGVTEIGERAFLWCYNVAFTGELPRGLTVLNKDIFNTCRNLQLSGTLPPNITEIGEKAFDDCSKLALTGELPSGLTSIGTSAFRNCTNLTLTGDIPENVTYIGNDTFDFTAPTKTHFDKNLSSVVITSDMTIPTSYTINDTFTDGTATITTTKYGYVGDTSSIGTAPTYEGYILKTDCTDATITIGSTDADRLNLTRVYGPDLPEGCIKKWEIGRPTLSDVIAYLYYKNGTDNTDGYKIVWEGTGTTNTFASDYDNQNQPWKSYMSEIVEVEIKEGVTDVDTNAFRSCTNLKTVSLPTTMQALDNYAFRYCSNLETINLPEGLSVMGEGVFNCDTALKNIIFPSTLVWIGRASFQYSGVSGDIVMPNKTDVIGSVGFQGCENIKTFAFPELDPSYKRTVNNGVISDCNNLTDVTITSSFNEIHQGAMERNTSLKRIHLNNVTLNTDYTIMTKNAGVPCTWYRANGDPISVLEAGTLYNETIYRDAYTVTFDANGGYFNDAPTATTLAQTVVDNGIVGTLEEPTREGYTFNGWVTPTGEPFDPNVDIITGDCTIKADWKIITYSIKFVDYDGRTISSKIYDKGSAIKIPLNPTRTGYNFVGWTPSVSAVANSNVVYTATYTAIPKTKYTIEFIDYDDKVLSNVEYDEGSIVNLPTSPTRDGYRFTGWSPTVNIKAIANATYKAEYERDEKEDIPVPEETPTPAPAPAPIPVVDEEEDSEPLPTPEKQEEKPLTPVQKLINAIDGGFRPEDTVEEEVKEETTEKKPVEEAKPTPETQPKTPSDEDYEIKSDISDTVKRAAVATLITGAVGVGLVATGGFNYLYMLLLCLLFKKRKVRFHGLLTNEENKFIKTRNMSEDAELVQAIIDKHDTFTEAVEDIKGLEGETLLPPNTKMDISFIAEDGYEETHTYDANEDDMFKELEKFKDMDVLVNIYCNKAKVDIKLKFHL